MLRIAKSLLTIAAVAAIATGATGAYFSDAETSNGNSFISGTLDLNLDGGNTNVVKFNVSNMKPGNDLIGTWEIKNVGTIPGYVDLKNIAIVNAGGVFTDAENDAGDAANAGNLGSLLSLTLFVDNNGNGSPDVGDIAIYTGTPDGIASAYNQNILLAADATSHITALVDWSAHAGTLDNTGQGDTMNLNMTFELGQTM